MDDREKMLSYISASVGMENQFLDEGDLKNINDFLDKKITEKQAIYNIKQEFSKYIERY